MRKKSNFETISRAFEDLAHNTAVDIKMWHTPILEEAIGELTRMKNTSVSDTEVYAQFCRNVFDKWSRAPDAKRGYGVQSVNDRAYKISFEDVALKAIENGDGVLLTEVLKHVEPTDRNSLLLRHAIQHANSDAVRVLLPVSNIAHAAPFAVETACKTANMQLLEIFLPHVDPTAMDFHILRYAAYRCTEKRTEEHTVVLQRIFERADQMCADRNEPPLSSNPSQIPANNSRVQDTLTQAARAAQLTWNLNGIAQQYIEKSNARSRKI